VLRDQLSEQLLIIAPDRIDYPAGEHEARPTWQTVASRERELRIGKLGSRRLELAWMIPRKLCRKSGVASMHGAEHVFGLVFELIEIRSDGKVTIGHDGPPSLYARSVIGRKRRFV
jgi:hypothetical protein